MNQQLKMDQPLVWLAPAKLNLFLRVLNRRSDGMHNLQTIFQLLNFGDQMTFSLSQSGGIERDYDFVPFDVDLCVRAVQALEKKVQKKLAVKITLDKRLPMGGGVGGGSSDAAITLVAVNHLWGLGFTKSELMAIGLGLGADVPVFVHGQSVWAEGVGERFTAIQLPEENYLVVTPNVSVSTAEIFTNNCLTRGQDAITIRDFHEGRAHNELESIVRESYSLVDNTFKWLEQYGDPVMTGTGASVFLRLNSREKACQIAEECPKFATAFIARGIQQHPYYDGVWPSG